MSSRYVGMSCRQRPPPLLKTINGKTRNKLDREVAFDAAPLSSGDEDDEAPTPKLEKSSRSNGWSPAADDKSSDGSESESRTRGGIKRTVFSRGNDKSKIQGVKRPGYAETRDSIADEFNEGAQKANKRRKVDGGARSRSVQSTQDQSTPKSSGYLKDEQGFTKRRPKAATYGSQKNASSQGSQKQKAKRDGSSKAAKLLAPEPLSSPRKSRKANILAPRSSISSSPTKEPPRRIREQTKDDNSDLGDLLDSPEKSKASFKRLNSLSQASQCSQDSQGSESKRKRNNKGTIWGQPVPKATPPRQKSPPRSPRAKFMMPEDFLDIEKEVGQGQDVSDLPSDLEFLGDSTVDECMPVAMEEEQDSGTTSCPWCGLTVETKMLREFSKGKRMGVKLQEKFCRRHKRETALDTWRTRHYPTIQWTCLEDRFAEHREFLLGIIDGEPSHFRDLIAKDIGSGQAARSVRKEGNLTPGYYGPRGFDSMSQYIREEFEDSLREKAVSDRVISGRGPMAFVQTVLVAELAVRLIQDDMDVSAKEAREIMEESKALGELLHE